jgi:hypothetical protein
MTALTAPVLAAFAIGVLAGTAPVQLGALQREPWV